MTLTLEEAIPQLIELDTFRELAKKMLDETKSVVMNLARTDPDNRWTSSGDAIESALVARAQKKFAIQRTLQDRLLNLSLTQSTKSSGSNSSLVEPLTTLTAARVMQALVATSKHAFSSTTLQCYYRIVRELYSASGPDWNIGGARAGSTGRATAFVTGECVRAISAFEDSLRHTATYFSESHKLRQAWRNIQRVDDSLSVWKEEESTRLALSWYAKTDVRLGAIALHLKPKEPMTRPSSEYIERELAKLENELPEALADSKHQFQTALKCIDALRAEEKRSATEDKEGERSPSSRPKSTHLAMQETGHWIGRSVVEKAVQRANDALQTLPSPGNAGAVDLEALSQLFRKTAYEVAKILEPAKRFLETVLDHELYTASTGVTDLTDVPELAFSAASLGATTNWQDERLARACSLLAESISNQGDCPVGRPILSTEDGFRIDPVGFEVIRACSQLVEKVQIAVDPQFPKKLLQPFIKLSVPSASKLLDQPAIEGWTFEHRSPTRPSKWATALAVLSLRQYTRMLDAVINRTALKYFDVSTPEPGDLNLEEMIYSDIGLVRFENSPQPTSYVFLEKLRAHLLSSNLPDSYQDPLFSIVLYGPPGTGKTTLLSALAATCKVPLVNISPSDFVVRGQEGVERRARSICTALSLLSDVVIILDEFEPILKNRQSGTKDSHRSGENLMLRALTPSMLPKLTRLHKRAKRQRLVYGLVTNHYHDLDSAAIRKGRFDTHAIVLRPDPLSRAGFFLKQLSDPDGAWALSPDEVERLARLVQLTSQCSVQFLARSLSKKNIRQAIRNEDASYLQKLKILADEEKSSARADSGDPPTPKTPGDQIHEFLKSWEEGLGNGGSFLNFPQV